MAVLSIDKIIKAVGVGDSKDFTDSQGGKEEENSEFCCYFSAVHLLLTMSRSRYNLSTALQRLCLCDVYSCKAAKDDKQFP